VSSLHKLTLFSFLLIASTRAQNSTYVSGLISDASAASVPGAVVTVVNEDLGFRRETLSRSDGTYYVSSLEPGSYKITVRKPGFRTMIRFAVKLTEGHPARADFSLVIGSIQETITVEGETASLSATDTSVTTLVGRDLIEPLPVNGRSLLHVLEFAPGLIVTPATNGEAGQFTVNGQRPNANLFLIDGLSANSGVAAGGSPAEATGGTLPGMTAFGSLDSIASLDELQDVRIQTSSANAQFGRLPGAQVSVTSQSGSNGLHGSILYGLRNQVLDANDWFANQQGLPRVQLNLQHVVPEVGGPLWRNHTFFFVSYEHLQFSQPMVFRSPVPAIEPRQNATDWAQRVLDLFPQPNGPLYGNNLAEWTGQATRPGRLDGGSVRIDQAIMSRLTGFARYHESASSVEFGSTPVNWLDLRTGTITSGVNYAAGPDVILDLRANGSRTGTRSAWQPAVSGLPTCYLAPVASALISGSTGCDFLTRVSIAGAGQVVAGSEGRRSQVQDQIAQTLTMNHRSHAIRIGADFRQLQPYRRDANPALNIIANSVNDFFGSGNLWTSSSPAKLVSGRVREISVYAHDTWQINRNLTATFGVRWEISPAPVSSQTASYFTLLAGHAVAPNHPIWQSNYNLAPRGGIAYRFRGGSTILRAGAGLYFNSSLSLATDLVNDGPLNVAQYGSARYAPFSSTLLFGFSPGLQLPRVAQWNVSVERMLTDHDAISAGYVGASANNLIRREIGGEGSTDLTWLALATNHGESAYHSMQAQYRRRFAGGLQALVSYAWSHSTDNSSSDGNLYWAGAGMSPGSDHASSNFDVRQSFTAGFSWQIPHAFGWTLDGVLRVRSGFPINILNTGQFLGVPFENVYRPNLVGGVPLWVDGRRINPSAFRATPDGTQGNLGRNALTGFGMNQVDLAMHRDLVLRDQHSIEVRIEAYNALNHPNFADPTRILASPLFGRSVSMLNSMLGTGSPGSGLSPLFQSGGPRSVQLALRYRW
jgi:hypothetical protein